MPVSAPNNSSQVYQIVNDTDQHVEQLLKPLVGQTVQAAGIGATITAPGFILTWVNGKTVIPLAGAVPFLQGSSFATAQRYLTIDQQKCLGDLFGQQGFTDLAQSRATAFTWQQVAGVAQCLGGSHGP